MNYDPKALEEEVAHDTRWFAAIDAQRTVISALKAVREYPQRDALIRSQELALEATLKAWMQSHIARFGEPHRA